MKPDGINQKERVLNHLIYKGGITPLDALKLYGIMRLSARINDLRKEGWLISADLKPVPNRFGGTTHVCEYRCSGRSI